MNPNEELQALYELTDNGTHDAWPEEVGRSIAIYNIRFGGGNRESSTTHLWKYTNATKDFTITTQHALDLVRASIERWLVGEGWEIFKVGDTVQYSRDEYDVQFNRLTEAICWSREAKSE